MQTYVSGVLMGVPTMDKNGSCPHCGALVYGPVVRSGRYQSVYSCECRYYQTSTVKLEAALENMNRKLDKIQVIQLKPDDAKPWWQFWKAGPTSR